MSRKSDKAGSTSIRLIGTVLCLLAIGRAGLAVPCTPVKSKPDSWVTTKVNALVQAARAAYEDDRAQLAYDGVIKRIAETLRQCKLSEDEGFVKRHPQFVEYIRLASFAQLPDHELGFTVPDSQYFEETRQYVQIPEFLLTQTFLRLVSREATLSRAKLVLQELNQNRSPGDQLIFFSYRSQHLGTPDNSNSYERLIVIVPGNTEQGVPEKWVQFGITDRGLRRRTRNLSVVSAIHGPDGSSNFYFKDYYRTYARDGSISVKGRWELGYGDDNCVSCHKSGILPIFPAPGSVKVSEHQALVAVNERFLSYGAPRFQNYLDTGKLGPGLTSASLESRIRRFGAGFSKSVVGRAMTCAACHNQERLGALNWPMDSVLIKSFIEGGQMPLGHKLKTSQRQMLYRKVIQEYFATDDDNPGILKSWLLGSEQ